MSGIPQGSYQVYSLLQFLRVERFESGEKRPHNGTFVAEKPTLTRMEALGMTNDN